MYSLVKIKMSRLLHRTHSTLRVRMRSCKDPQLCVSTNLADFSERAGIERTSSILWRVLKRVLSLAADERAKRENTGFAGIDRIRSSYYHRLNISRRYEREGERKMRREM